MGLADYVQRGAGLLQDALNRGAVAGTIGAPVDLATLLANAAIAGGGYVGHKTGMLKTPPSLIDPEQVPMSSEWVGQKMQNAGMVSAERSPYLEMGASLLPTLAAIKAPQIASAALKAQANAAAPRTLHPQRGVIPVSFAKADGKPVSLPQDEVFSSAVANTPGAAVSGDGLLLRIQRNQVPEQGMRPSVRGGVFYLPEGAAQAKHYSTGKNGYGGSERIAGETLIKNPVFVKGATGGKAPAAAMDSLLGKGAYESMRNEALKAYGPYGASPRQKAEAARAFLDKYAPELADYADYIVDSSQKGNQLAYALQEAAVGSAVRKAGHDSVLGFSKNKSGAPFISELFDVREQLYPDKFGGFGVWE